MNRRDTVLALLALGAAPLVSFGQTAQKLRRIGFLTLDPPSEGGRKIWWNSLQRAGYEEGTNLVIEWRSANGFAERLPALADELIRLNVELILCVSNDATDAARHATQTIPIVMSGNNFPVERGLVKSFSHPGGNITGTVYWADPQATSMKILEIIKDALPKAKRLATLSNPEDPQIRFFDNAEYERGAATVALKVQGFGVTRPNDLKVTLDRIAASRPDAIYVAGSILHIVGSQGLQKIIMFAIERKLPLFADFSGYVVAGGLLSYGPDLNDLVDRTVSYVDRILRGAKPADLPIEQTAKWNLVLNAKTARAIGFKPPPSFMLRVTKQID